MRLGVRGSHLIVEPSLPHAFLAMQDVGLPKAEALATRALTFIAAAARAAADASERHRPSAGRRRIARRLSAPS